MTQTLDNQKGFTLIELMISIAIFGVVIAGVIGAFQDQLLSHNTQQRVLNMQQNARAAMYYMTRELKMAGLDPTGNAGAGIITADDNILQFSMDFTGGYCGDEAAAGEAVDDDDDDGLTNEGCNGLNENGNTDAGGNDIVDEPDEWEWFDGDTADANENITYTLSNDTDGDGECDGVDSSEANDDSACNLMRGNQILAVNIDAIDFKYLGRNPATPACGIRCPLGPLPLAADQRNNVRSVQITLVARDSANRPVFTYRSSDNRTYRTPDQTRSIVLPAQNDGFRRFYLANEIRCRNLGLE